MGTPAMVAARLSVRHPGAPLACQQTLDDPELLLDHAGERVIVDEIQYAPSLLPHNQMRIDRRRDARGVLS